jgi:hypothetical protein
VYLGGNPRPRTQPAALAFVGTGLVTVLYLALNAVFFSRRPGGTFRQLEIGRIAAHALGGPAWANAPGSSRWRRLRPCQRSDMAGPRGGCTHGGGWLSAALAAADSGRRAAGFPTPVSLAMLWSATQPLAHYIGFTLSLSTAATRSD